MFECIVLAQMLICIICIIDILNYIFSLIHGGKHPGLDFTLLKPPVLQAELRTSTVVPGKVLTRWRLGGFLQLSALAYQLGRNSAIDVAWSCEWTAELCWNLRSLDALDVSNSEVTGCWTSTDYSDLSRFFNCRVSGRFSLHILDLLWSLMGRSTNSKTCSTGTAQLIHSVRHVQHDRGICKAMPSCHQWCLCHFLWGWEWTAYKQSKSREVELMRSFGNSARYDEE